jgi:hypothetical protein
LPYFASDKKTLNLMPLFPRLHGLEAVLAVLGLFHLFTMDVGEREGIGMRVKQAIGVRGSLKWIQRAANDRNEEINKLILLSVPGAAQIGWLSPLSSDEFAEYRDESFLQLVGRAGLDGALSDFWPTRGPQWDALARTDTGEIVLVEAKAHIDEMFSTRSQASTDSPKQIRAALDQAILHFGAKPLIDWAGPLYQMANRLARLHFLAVHGVPARLVFVRFIGDRGGMALRARMNGAARSGWLDICLV